MMIYISVIVTYFFWNSLNSKYSMQMITSILFQTESVENKLFNNYANIHDSRYTYNRLEVINATNS